MSASPRDLQMSRTGACLREDAPDVASCARAAGELNDDLVRRHLVVLQAASRIACAAGCSHCCALDVAASFPEVARVATHLEATRSADDLRDLRSRLAARIGEPRGQACILLQDDRCTVYEARPLACRGWNSADAAACAVAAAHPGEPPSIPVNPMLRTTALDIARGLTDGAREAGLDARPLDLPRALSAILGRVEEATADWLAGRVLAESMQAPRAERRSLDSDGRWREGSESASTRRP